MKKTLLILAMALLIALPAFGLAAEETAAPETETTPAPAAQYGRRWRQTAPQSRFEDADNDGICDNCGQAQGQNPDAPGFTDENKDGICDRYNTPLQGQGGQGRFSGRGQRMGRMNRMGRMGCGMRGNAQGQGQGRGFVDADGDGVCDHFGTNSQPSWQLGPGRPGGRPGRNRR